MSKKILFLILMKLKIWNPYGLGILYMKFEWDRRQKFFWHRRVPPLNFSENPNPKGGPFYVKKINFSDFEFHQNRRWKIFWHRRVPPLDFSVNHLKSGFLAVEFSQLCWQMVFLTNFECPNIYLLRKINRPHGLFCLHWKILQSNTIIWANDC